MAAREEQLERVVVLLRVRLVVRGDLPRDRVDRPDCGDFARSASLLARDVVRHPPRCDLIQPAAGIRRRAALRPLHERGEQRLLHRVLGRREVAEAPHQGAEHPRRGFAQQVLGSVVRLAAHTSGGPLITGRSSMGTLMRAPPIPGAAEASAAISIARRSESTSTIQKPARSSFDSGNGPSVIAGGPFWLARTIFACSGPLRPCASTSSPASDRRWLKSSMNWMCARTSFAGQVWIGGLSPP